jgi:hypothetical protein
VYFYSLAIPHYGPPPSQTPSAQPPSSSFSSPSKETEPPSYDATPAHTEPENSQIPSYDSTPSFPATGDGTEPPSYDEIPTSTGVGNDAVPPSHAMWPSSSGSWNFRVEGSGSDVSYQLVTVPTTTFKVFHTSDEVPPEYHLVTLQEYISHKQPMFQLAALMRGHWEDPREAMSGLKTVNLADACLDDTYGLM